MVRSIRNKVYSTLDRLRPPSSGRVQEVFRGDIVGWLNDIQSRVPHDVFISTDLGHTARFGAHMWHADAIRAVGASGNFGFAIPIELLPAFERTVEVRNVHGDLLLGGRLRPPKRAQADERHRFLIVHIPKTAGTSLREFLLHRIRQSRFCAVYANDPGHLSEAEFLALPEEQKGHFRVIMGHVAPSFSRFMSEDTRLITFLRHPIDRLKSHILHHVRVAGVLIGSQHGDIPLEDAVNDGVLDLMDNLQTRTIVEASKQDVPELSAHHLVQATQRIKERYAFLGLAENGEADIRRLGRMLGLRGSRVSRLNTAPVAISDEASRILDRINWKTVEDRHWIDFDLFHWARANARHIGLHRD